MMTDSWLADVADSVAIDWPRLAGALGMTNDDIVQIRNSDEPVGAQAHAMLQSWSCSRGPDATVDQLEHGLCAIGRDDVAERWLRGTVGGRTMASTTSRTSFDSCTCGIHHCDV
jgi:Death domain